MVIEGGEVEWTSTALGFASVLYTLGHTRQSPGQRVLRRRKAPGLTLSA